MQVVSLYTGILGLDIAAHAAGFTTAAACDSEPFCRAVIRHYCPDIPIYESDTEVSLARLRADGITGPITAVIGGPPCQDASIAGRRAGQTGDRWRWPEYLRVVNDLRPRWFVAENPTGILSVNNREAFGWLLTEVAEMGYVVGWSTYGANAVGAPHRRERVFIVGRLADACGVSGERWGGTRHTASPTGTAGGDGPNTQVRHAFSDNGADVADAAGAGRFSAGLCCGSTTRVPEPTNGSAVHRLAPAPFDSGNAAPRPAQLRVGSLLDGLPSRLAQHPVFPAGPQEEQYPWEPPRLTTGEDNRAVRLKALGNAVVPAQAYPVFAAIAAVGRAVSGERKVCPKDGGYAQAVGGLGATTGLHSQYLTRTEVTTGWEPTCTHAAPVVPCTVLDPFAGSGTTLAVATRLGRQGVGIELNPEYITLAQARLFAANADAVGPLFADTMA